MNFFIDLQKYAVPFKELGGKQVEEKILEESSLVICLERSVKHKLQQDFANTKCVLLLGKALNIQKVKLYYS